MSKHIWVPSRMSNGNRAPSRMSKHIWGPTQMSSHIWALHGCEITSGLWRDGRWSGLLRKSSALLFANYKVIMGLTTNVESYLGPIKNVKSHLGPITDVKLKWSPAGMSNLSGSISNIEWRQALGTKARCCLELYMAPMLHIKLFETASANKDSNNAWQ